MTIYNFELLNVPFANTAVASEIADFPDYNRGFGIAFSLTNGKPEMKSFNGLLKMVTTSIIYLKQRGISEWDSTFEYVAGKSFVVDGDKLYQAKTTNTNKQPSLSQNDWVLRASISDIKVSTNGNLKRTENQDGTITLEVPTANTDQRGAVRQATNTEVANKSNVNAYITPKNVADMFVGGFGENDSIQLPNGLILQWGVSQPTAAKGVVVLKTSMPNAVLNAQLTPINNSGWSITTQPMWDRSTTNKSQIGFICSSTDTEQIEPMNFSWFAIGY